MNYCDWTASGRCIAFIENYIQEEILPIYANTHTRSSFTGHQTELFREEARVIITHAVNASKDKDVVIFTGNGVTGAVNHLIRAMRLAPNDESIPESNRPVVFVSIHEHHSNLLPWRESKATVVNIPEDENGRIDEKYLEEKLIEYNERPLKIGSFTAASNITSILQDTLSITKLLHKYNALSFWDYATAGPYVDIDMNPVVGTDFNLVAKDAIFLSPHKFPGGPGTPGILIAKKFLFDKTLEPHESGGGVIKFVTPYDHIYESKIHIREESGTPNIIGCIKAGLVFQLKENVGVEYISKIENKYYQKAVKQWSQNPYIHILGPTGGNDRIPILSFVIYHESGKLLHYNFVCSLLNDLFGIQARGGCVCAGPYGLKLLGLEENYYRDVEYQLSNFDDVEVIRPGFVRINFNYFVTEEEVQYVLDAVDFIAKEGWKLLPKYAFRTDTNEWHHLNFKKLPGRKWLGDISYASGKMEYPKRIKETQILSNLRDYLVEAQNIVDQAVEEYKENRFFEDYKNDHILLRDDAEKLRWFVYPEEVFVKKIDIDKTNCYKNEDWRAEFRKTCPFVPIYYNVEPQTTSTKIYVRPDRFSASIVDKSSNSVDKISNGTKSDASIPKSSCSTGVCPRPSVKTYLKNNQNPPKTKPKKQYETKGKVEHKLFKYTLSAIRDFDLIQPGDRILVGVSGGKDSLSLLEMLIRLKKKIPFSYEVGAVTIDPQTAEYDPSPLKTYMAERKIPYFYDSQPILSIANDVCPTSICSWCSRMKRGILHNICEREGYNVLALGHHLDDLAESFLMFGFHNGKLEAMKAAKYVRNKSVRIIRPFVYVREKDTKMFARYNNLPIITENCPACFEEPKERARVKSLLKAQERLHPDIFHHLKSALKPLMHPDISIEEIFDKAMKTDKKLKEIKWFPKRKHDIEEVKEENNNNDSNK